MWLIKGVVGGAVVALATVAHAADMPVRKAPMPAEPMLPQASGYVELYGGWASTKETVTFCDAGCTLFRESFNGWVLGGAGRGNYWFNPNMSVQLDAQAEGTSYRRTIGPTSSNFSMHSYLIGGHANWRDPQRGLLGIFAGAGDSGGGFGPATRHAIVGGEAQWYWQALTLYFQGGYDTTIGDTFGIDGMHAWFVRGTGRYFVTPNMKFEGTVLYANGEIDWTLFPTGSQGFYTWLWEAKFEARASTHPFAFFAKYQGSQTKYDTATIGLGATVDEKVTDHRILVGLKLFMGERDLLWSDRQGATLDIIAPLAAPSAPLNVPPSIGGNNAILITVN